MHQTRMSSHTEWTSIQPKCCTSGFIWIFPACGLRVLRWRRLQSQKVPDCAEFLCRSGFGGKGAQDQLAHRTTKGPVDQTSHHSLPTRLLRHCRAVDMGEARCIPAHQLFLKHHLQKFKDGGVAALATQCHPHIAHGKGAGTPQYLQNFQFGAGGIGIRLAHILSYVRLSS